MSLNQKGTEYTNQLAKPINSNAVQVNEKQRGNPILRHVRLIPWVFNSDIVPDYVMGSTCALFLSIKYYLLHPMYIEKRIHEIGKNNFKLRVLLVLNDDVNSNAAILNLNTLCFNNEFTLVMTWSNEECARYIETLKYYEEKPALAIQVFFYFAI